MSEFENQQDDASEISTEIARTLIALGVDWGDDLAMRALAREALSYHGSLTPLAAEDIEGRSKQKLFGLIGLMLKTMEEGAELGEVIHGSEVWKSLAKALWLEKEGGVS